MLRVLLLLCLLVVPARAEMPAGHDDPAYQAAVDLWLSGDDERALPELSRLAHARNTAAQVLLGRIESSDSHSVDWRLRNSDRYHQIFRTHPAGHSRWGRRWMEVAAETSELAGAFLGYVDFDPEKDAGRARRLSELGELRAMYAPVTALWHQDPEYLVPLAEAGIIPRYLKYFGWTAALKTARKEQVSLPAAIREDILRAVNSDDVGDLMVQHVLFWGHTDLAKLSKIFPKATWQDADFAEHFRLFWFRYGSPEWFTERQVSGRSASDFDFAPDWLVEDMMDVPELSQRSAMCREICSTEAIACMRAAHSYGQGYGSLMGLGSPVETLIPQERYVQSARARQEMFYDLSRRSRRSERAGGYESPDAFYASMAEESACLANHARAYHDEITRAEQ